MATEIPYNKLSKNDNPPEYSPQEPNMTHMMPSAPNVMPSPGIITPVATFTQHLAVGPKAQTMMCPSCRQTIKTVVCHRTTTKTHGMACLLCVLCCLPCMCIPYCMDTCRDANHNCPNCDAFIGTYKN